MRPSPSSSAQTKAEIAHLESISIDGHRKTRGRTLSRSGGRSLVWPYQAPLRAAKGEDHKPPVPLPFQRRFHIYVGKTTTRMKNSTSSFANGGDWWFHAKELQAPHVIVKD